MSAFNSGRLESLMGTPTGPSVAVSAGGSVPVGTVQYKIQWIDVDGNYSPISPPVNAVTTTGNQTVTLTPPTPPAGAVAWVAYRNDAEVANPPGGCGTGAIPITSTFVDSVGFACGSASPMSSLAEITSRRAMKRGSSPASTIRAR